MSDLAAFLGARLVPEHQQDPGQGSAGNCRCCIKYSVERSATGDDGLCDGCREYCT
jgi:hypothetical protein